MGELNPQVKKQLRVVEKSQPMVPVVTCFRSGFSETLKQRVIKAAEGSSGKPSFKQLMALFKCDGLVHQPVSSMESARQLLAKYGKLCVGANGTETATQASARIAGKEQP
jgi:phosphonate transport system substrate-binding protein